MSDKMTPIPFADLMNWILEEKNTKSTVFGINRPYIHAQGNEWSFLGGKLETPFGPAAGPHTQLAQNIIAAYYAGSRFFELKTVQILDGEDLPVSKPCIKADDEGYNVEWSTELYVPQAFDEYVKAWFALHVISKEFGLGSADGFQFNMSVGYDLDGIKTPKIDSFIEGLRDASQTAVWQEAFSWIESHISAFKKVDSGYLKEISAHVCGSITLSTLHGCPPQEIERIASYLIETKHFNTFIKCQVCGSITRIRLQVGWQEEHPIVVACGKCGTSLSGNVEIGQDKPGLKFSFDNADEVLDEAADYMVECSGEFSTVKQGSAEELEGLVITPFI